MRVEVPRVKAWQYEQSAIDIDTLRADDSEPLAWPDDAAPQGESEILDVRQFQAQYVDIIPASWTAVSLCLSEDCTELFVARYRAEQSPLVLKLPFARQKPDGVDDEAFDFHKGKAELQEIVDLSNYTCHNPAGMGVKGAKTKWWNEREALDRRLHELLINIENIWFGGFKSIFAQRALEGDLLARFRVTFDQILAKYLPSRQTNQDKSRESVLDDQVLLLFIGLGCDDSSIDIDEPLADLLYFVVDMLQFNGERNAYDEIDFDSMAIDVVDALRVYQDSWSSHRAISEHLVLVLDRRLQAFPWESLPCLQETSVSRVGSMLSLRQCLMAKQIADDGNATTSLTAGRQDCHVVQRTSGTYILNPSSDLTGTQTMLQPALSTLSKELSTTWTSMVNEVPTEDKFSSALQSSAMLLYFGHGAGSQYIRTRAIKRLEQCSEVVWLMGCSSGAIQEHGDLEPSAVPLAYLGAGRPGPEPNSSRCKAVVATLWDVTDKDIDRFSLAMGEEWGLWPASEQHKLPVKTPRKREIVAAPCTPEQLPKTPKTPKVQKTPAPIKTPAKSKIKAKQDAGKKLSLVEAVARSRESCYLRYLNGAAPVVYGIPVYLGD
jgi:separase